MAIPITYTTYRKTTLDQNQYLGSVFSGGFSVGGSANGSGGGAEYILKTGDTATGTYNFNTNLFVINSTTNRVGIGTSTPSYLFDVNGDGHFSNNLYVTGALSIGTTSTSEKINVVGNVKSTGEFISILNSYGNLRMIAGSYGMFFRFDSTDFYLLVTDVNDQYGAWNSLRPFHVTVTGHTRIGNGKLYVEHLGGVGINTTSVSGYAFTINGTTLSKDYLYAETHVGSPSFASGFSGYGWKMEYTLAGNNAILTADSLFIRKSLTVYELIISQIRASNGSIWVSDSAKIASVTNLGGSLYRCYIDTDSTNISQPFLVDDIVRAQKWTGRDIRYYIGQVTAVDSGGEHFTISILESSGVPLAGDSVIRQGSASNTNRQGAIYLTASDNNAPYIDVLDTVTGASLANKTKVRLGKLTGITDSDLGGALSGYGLYSNNVYLKGVIKLAASSSGFANFSDLPGPLTSPSGSGLFISSSNMGYYTSGQWKTYMDNSGNFVLGDYGSGGAGLSWSQATASLNIRGTINATTGRIGGWYIGATTLHSGTSGERIVLDSDNVKITAYGSSDDVYLTIDATSDTTSPFFQVVGGDYFCRINYSEIDLDSQITSRFYASVYGGSQLQLLTKGLPSTTDDSYYSLMLDTSTGQVYRMQNSLIRAYYNSSYYFKASATSSVLSLYMKGLKTWPNNDTGDSNPDHFYPLRVHYTSGEVIKFS